MMFLRVGFCFSLLFCLSGALASHSLPSKAPIPSFSQKGAEETADTVPATATVTEKEHPPTFSTGLIDFSEIECIFSDMDGTLLHPNHRVSSRAVQAIKQIQLKGKKFFPATGRNRKSFLSVIDKEFVKIYGNKNIPGVFSQGLNVYSYSGELIHEEVIDFRLIKDIENYLQTNNITYCAYSRDRLFTAQWNHYIQEITKYKENLPEFISETLTKLKPLGLNINKIMLLAEESTILYHRPILEKMYEGKVTFTRAVPGMLEILPYGSSKGKGVQKFLEYHKIHPSKVIAFGDAENDIEMLKFVKYGIAMKNAKSDIFQYAFCKTVHTNAEDGVAHILEHI